MVRNWVWPQSVKCVCVVGRWWQVTSKAGSVECPHTHTHTHPVYTYAHTHAHTHTHALVHTHTHTHTLIYIYSCTHTQTHTHTHTHVHAHMLINTLIDVHTSTHIYILISYMHVLLHYCLTCLIVIMPQNRNEKGRDQNTERSAAMFLVPRWWIACPHLGAHCFPALAP